MSYLQQKIDENPKPGHFILTGSQHFVLSERISQSLAGRTAILELLPFSIAELERGNFLADDLDHVFWQGLHVCADPSENAGFCHDRALCFM